MPWYLVTYLLVFVALGIAGIVDDWRSRRPFAWIAAMVTTLLVGVLSVSAFAFPGIGNALRGWLWALLAFAVAMEVVSAVSDLRSVTGDGETSRFEAVLSMLAVAALTLPAYALGVIAAARTGSE